MKYSAPISGKYLLSFNFVERVPTGKFELQKNSGRKWYQFWKPKMVLREVYELKELPQHNEVKELKKGEKVSGRRGKLCTEVVGSHDPSTTDSTPETRTGRR